MLGPSPDSARRAGVQAAPSGPASSLRAAAPATAGSRGRRVSGRGAGWPGRARLGALCEGYLGYVQRRVFPGGCFFVATAAELGGRPGRVHDLVATYPREWRDLLEQTARAASRAGELDTDSDPAQLAFELATLLAGTNILTVLHDDDAAIDHARRAVAARLSTGLGGGPSVANWTRPGSRAEGGA
jgi:hypothetical protein